jgi:23S rRNA pseudouridine1911/1915/1917 synthase
MKILNFCAEPNENGKRIDIFLSKKIENISRSYIEKLIGSKKISIKKNCCLIPVKKNYMVKSGEQIEIIIPEPKKFDSISQNLPIEIVYEDKDLMIINKPKGMVVHPAPGSFSGTLVNALLFLRKNELSGINGPERPGIVHRLDKNTSGLLVVAKNDFSHWDIAQKIKNHNFKREYEAIVNGRLDYEAGKIDAPIGRHPKDRKKMAIIDKNSKYAVTNYKVLRRFKNFTHVNLSLETGRTHQIRVHMAYIGHPVAGDEVYGKKNKKQNFEGQCLHAKTIGFVHPRTKKYVEFSSDIPKYFKNFLVSIQ